MLTTRRSPTNKALLVLEQVLVRTLTQVGQPRAYSSTSPSQMSLCTESTGTS